MTSSVQDALQQALALTIQMSDAASDGNWTLVAELDAQRQIPLQHVQNASLDIQHRDTLAALQAYNRAVLERTQQVHDSIEQQLSQHQYNHRALRSYVSSSR
ncbi:hypothetical protein [Dyella nitratireducens]|uniref:Flagellar protein FliT n=1 Tax=Dyella nitratireducens TaxID=1849580 RepID=A0ABQ1FS08_9GAMM|nr:hypothetical protein [Dyella nitratireducens]GGA27637.1 hypothetical protein GCM10010981_15480 [Dyella nitratireducens]GLQ43387.1 hypothetical protein GCM10007902_32370 [Dyella nitratireducens]